jgi:WD40 repeat protein
VALTSNGNFLATADGNGHAYIWDLSTRRIVATLPDLNSKGVLAVAFSPAGHLAAGDANGSTYISAPGGS